MKVLGIDPGSLLTGYGIISKHDNHMQHLQSGVFKLKHLDNLGDRLHFIFESIRNIITLHQPHHMAIESVFNSKNVRSTVLLSHARASAILAARTLQIPVFEYSPMEIKRATVGYGHASKDQISKMLYRLFPTLNESSIKSLDQTDAISVALCHLNQHTHSQRINRALIKQDAIKQVGPT